MAVSANDFRNAMALWANTVAVVATGGPMGKRGLTVTSFASVTDSPPMVLACVSANSSSLPALLEHGAFSLNLLSAEQEAVANVFAGRTGAKGEARFDGLPLAEGTLGQPVLTDSLVSLECKLISETLHSTHKILIGEVVKVHPGSGEKPLLYWERGFHKLA